MVWFLVEDKGADYKITTNKGKSPIYLSANNRDVCMTQYYLELGEEMPKILPELRDNTDIATFFKHLCGEFRGKIAQHPEDIKYPNILAKLYSEQKKYIVYTSSNYDYKNINVEIYDKKIIGNIEDISDLV
ncbi:MAG TPA: hypothetical protein LFW21_02600 [Rickettsia endosymbiont of Pyrocoelia pectoralis]|nr:hypothetical protein [Rickettsia endosymbiont of Pyrocoelia pectoralis]